MDYQALLQLQKHLEHLCGVTCLIFDKRTKKLSGNSAPFCERCPHPCQYASTHLYGCYEADRWGGKYIYYCPMGFIFIAVTLSDSFADQGVIAGPLLMGAAEDFPETYGLNIYTTGKVTDLQEVLVALFHSEGTDPARIDVTTTEDFLDEIAKFMQETPHDTIEQYPIQLEQELQKAIMEKDAPNAKKILNQLLGHIFFEAGSNLKKIKVRVLELIVMLSRAAIEGGADMEQMFALNLHNVEQVEQMDSIEQLSVWLTNVMNRYISYVFEFTNIKHVDMIFKTISYIKEHYRQKLSLESIANHVYLSKSYLSKIFKEETGMSITNYINQVRVEKSKLFLTDRSYSLVDIANAVGFDDQSYYTKVFKSITGVSPGKYREAHGKK